MVKSVAFSITWPSFPIQFGIYKYPAYVLLPPPILFNNNIFSVQKDQELRPSLYRLSTLSYTIFFLLRIVFPSYSIPGAFLQFYFISSFPTLNLPQKTKMRLLSTKATCNSHGQDSSYFLGWQEYEKNPFDEVLNPKGIIQMGLAENQVRN